MLGLIHAEEENPQKKINAADEDNIKTIKFDEAVNFLKAKIPMDKEQWEQLEPKLRFRAFTVAKLGEAEYINKARQILIEALEKGTSYVESWNQLQQLVNTNALSIKPGYWENIFRTNTQSAYIAGKLQQYKNTKIQGYQLMVIEDSRTSKICKNLLASNGYGLVLPENHNFWKKYGFPPYHYQCRTSIRGIWKTQVGKIGNNVENVSMKSLTKFKPLEGFGGNPLNNGNWWMMTPSQMEQAIKYGCLNLFNREENIFADYDSVWKGYKRHEGKKGGWYDLTNNPPNDWITNNKEVVKFLAENGYKIKVLPSFENIKTKFNIDWTNPDIIINGKLADIKQVENSIKSRLKSAKNQKLRNVVLNIPESFSEEDIKNSFANWNHGKLTIIWIYKNIIHIEELK